MTRGRWLLLGGAAGGARARRRACRRPDARRRYGRLDREAPARAGHPRPPDRAVRRHGQCAGRRHLRPAAGGPGLGQGPRGVQGVAAGRPPGGRPLGGGRHRAHGRQLRPALPEVRVPAGARVAAVRVRSGHGRVRRSRLGHAEPVLGRGLLAAPDREHPHRARRPHRPAEPVARAGRVGPRAVLPPLAERPDRAAPRRRARPRRRGRRPRLRGLAAARGRSPSRSRSCCRSSR